MTAQAQRRLQVAREISGKSLRQVASEAGWDDAYISRVERGLQRPSVDFLIAIGRVLGIEDLKRLSLYWEPPEAAGVRR